MSSRKKVAIGIDLGTTCSCVGVFQNGKVDIIANSETGLRTTPSVVAFTSEGRLLGQAAKAQATINPKNTVFEGKRLIGRKFEDTTVQKDIKNWPFKIVGVGGAPMVRVEHRSNQKDLAPEQISAMVLSKMKTVAETYLGRSVCDAVITVPAYFSDSQRQATKDAGTIAGLNVLSILNEPTAAAIAYGVDKDVVMTRRYGNSKKVLVFDLGGGTFDVAVVTMSHLSYTVEAVGGDSHLGGSDFDNLLVEYLIQVIKMRYLLDVSKDQKALGRLKSASEEAKINLSSMLRTQISISGLLNGTDFDVVLTKNIFERLCTGLFQQTLQHVQRTLDDAGLRKDIIDEVILVGGSTRIPKVKQMLSEFFNGKKLNQTINPDEAVAYGAAVAAAIASGEHSVPELSLTDVTPLSLGLRNSDGSMVVSVNRNTKIPVSVIEDNWTTSENYQTSGQFLIYEGEDRIADNNNLLGSFTLTNLQVAAKGVPKLAAQFRIDANGILQVSATDLKTGSRNSVTIASDKGRLSKAEVARMARLEREFDEAHDFSGESEDEEEDELEEEEEEEVIAGTSTELKHLLENYCFSLKLNVGCVSEKDTITEAERQAVVDFCDIALDWMSSRPFATSADYNNKLKELKKVCAPLTRKVAYSCLN